MRSYDEKLAIIRKFEKAVETLLPKMEADVKNMDFEKMVDDIAKYIETGEPVLQMYAAELSAAITPASETVMPLVIAALESALDCLKARHKEAAGVAQTIKKGIKAISIETMGGGKR